MAFALNSTQKFYSYLNGAPLKEVKRVKIIFKELKVLIQCNLFLNPNQGTMAGFELVCSEIVSMLGFGL